MKPTICFISHGGGPMPLLGDPGHQAMVEALQAMAASLPKPKVIVVISAHWEERQPTVTAGVGSTLLYDYYGFPPQSYEIQYPAAGAPELASALMSALEGPFSPVANTDKGLDHGVFVPLKIMYPAADIPVIQLSLLNSLDPAQHIAMGEALQKVDLSNVLVIGSGFSFHNMRAFFAPDSADMRARNQAFEDWLTNTVANPELDEAERKALLVNWASAPHARFCHPREEHLLPLHVCYGLAGRASDKAEAVNIIGKQAGMFTWLEISQR